MVSSAPIDVATPDGRETLVKWLANMSLCERDRLGYDPTLYFNREERRWEIEAYDDSTDAHKTFEIVSCMRISDRVCGRHTRCFRCKEIEASGDADKHGKPAEVCEVLVKRAWATDSQESDDKSRDEVSMLREINNTLKGNKDLEGKYPTLLAGGVVKITDENGEVFDDTVDTAFAGLRTETLKELGSRVQKSMAMTPIGQDIRRCKSADELIIAAADVMEVHTAILKQCKILHRDISINNILINRNGPGGRACGMLIDFDCALRIDDTTDHEARSEMTGTFPFMSVNNLEASKVIRTELDDWESIIYVLCWLGTFGVNTDDEEEHKRPDNDFDSLNIEKWRIGTGKESEPPSTPKNNKRRPEHQPSSLIATNQRNKRTASSNTSITGQVRSLSLNPEHTSQSTPQKSRSSHASTKSNITRSARDIRDERKKEAEYCVRHNMVPDALVAEVAKPRDDGLAAFTAQIATRVCESLEAFIHANEHSKKYAELVKWTGMKEQSPKSAMYSPISAFFTYVSKTIDSVHVGIPDGGSYSRACVILPYDITDRNPIGADDDTRIDIALRFASRNASDAELAQRYPGKPDYKDITAIVEVKREVGKEAEALK
ncbi:hypothetical protein IW138_006495 [Coemansia sp. RSA 986]|nr:hypothetical protein IW138_006495 [Coemansia sp. RSA 986]